MAKSNPWIVMVSTPNAPDGLFERIEKEPESTCLYMRLFLDYTYGLGRIYTQAEIDGANNHLPLKESKPKVSWTHWQCFSYQGYRGSRVFYLFLPQAITYDPQRI